MYNLLKGPLGCKYLKKLVRPYIPTINYSYFGQPPQIMTTSRCTSRIPSFVIRNICRRISTNIKNHTPIANFPLKCGLEIHTQLATRNKLFSLSSNTQESLASGPNKHVSFFDAALPGTQPKLNPEAVLYALKLALALNCEVHKVSRFDRKHYFYADQPQGYQITQHYKPIATSGHLTLSAKHDGITEDTIDIGITQIQLEQDTASSIHREMNNTTETIIDLNRNGKPLIELVTDPDFKSIKEVQAFLKKYQNLVRHLEICEGHLAEGNIRVDVNVSVLEHPRVELKNLVNSTTIVDAIRSEYNRQVKNLLERTLPKGAETRMWDGKRSMKIRGKENVQDYRYMPDPELPPIVITQTLLDEVLVRIPPKPDLIIDELMEAPYNLSLKDARILTINGNKDDLYKREEIRKYYKKTFQLFSLETQSANDKYSQIDNHLVSNWIIHDFIKNLKESGRTFSDVTKTVTPRIFSQFLMLIHSKKITNTTGKVLLSLLIQVDESELRLNESGLQGVIQKFGLEQTGSDDAGELEEIIRTVVTKALSDSPKLRKEIELNKKSPKLNYLIGLVMKETSGKFDPLAIKSGLINILEI